MLNKVSTSVDNYLWIDLDMLVGNYLIHGVCSIFEKAFLFLENLIDQ